MADIHTVIRSICTHFPEVDEVMSHGSPEYRVRNKAFASFSVNHHGDGKLALLLNASPETQSHYVNSAPNIFFVPPYVGPRGWYGIDLAAGMRWPRVAELAQDAYIRVAPRALGELARPLDPVPSPDTVDIRQIDPLFAPENQEMLNQLRRICLALPEVSESESSGMPAFRAGKKSFCQFSCRGGIPSISFWVGPEMQATLTADPRYEIPPYTGHNGWIRLRLDTGFDPSEVAGLAVSSYKHFALKRMLKQIED